MAGRKAALKAIDWLAFAERVPPNQKAMFNAFKTRSDAVAGKLAALPETPPAIDWAYYRKVIAKPGMVDEFENKFKALKIPEPVDTQSAKIAEEEKEASKQTAEFIKASNARIAEYQEQIQKFKNMIPFELMTLDDFYEAFPETKPDTEKYPFWPHRPLNEW
uniref:ATP synthase subunit d, mitochondrial n=1 Tax=Salvator merianae TaxID=96440 RepID=A0A8D0KP58_SALMN